MPGARSSSRSGRQAPSSCGRDGPPVDIAAPTVKAVDATGAGDALNGALAAGLASGLDLEQASRRAVVAASLSVTRAGAREGMPTARELAAAMGEDDGAPEDVASLHDAAAKPTAGA